MKARTALEKYLKLSAKADEYAEAARDMKQVMMDAMVNEKTLSLKTTDAIATIAKRVDKTVNETVFREWLEANPSVPVDEFYVTALNNAKVKDFAEYQKKTTGEVVPFITARESEYLMVKKAQ